MDDIGKLSERVAALRAAFADLGVRGWGELGDPNAETGECWDRGHVLGHVAEMIPFWTVQVRQVLAGSRTEIGRSESEVEERRAAIDGAHHAGEAELLRRIDAGLAGLEALLQSLQPADIAIQAQARRHGSTQLRDVGFILNGYLVNHVEEHLAQLRALSPAG